MSFLEDGRPNPSDKDEILTALIDSAEQAFGREFSPNERSVIRAFYEPVAEYAAGQQEDIADAVDASQIDYAEGDALGLLAALIGVSRREALPASTRLQVQHDSPVGRDYSIPQGSAAQTDSADPVVFETDYATTLPFLDDFEDNDITEYGGDTGSFSVQTGTVYEGSYALQGNAATANLLNTSVTLEKGARVHNRIYLNGGTTAAGFLFGVQDASNYYDAIVDANNNEIRLEVTDGGTTSTIGTQSASIPDSEWLYMRLDWKHGGEYDIRIENAAGNEIDTLSTSETTATFDTGGYGFSSQDANAQKFYDLSTTSRVSVDATATSTGVSTNVGGGTVTVLADTIAGVDTVTNPIAATGGRDREQDDDLRERAKTELSTAMRATLPALLNQLRNTEGVRAVTIIDNDTNSTDSDGRPGHSFEAIVDADTSVHPDIAETILNTKAVGDTSVGGYGGTTVTETLELENGQSKDITFSEPTPIDIYADISVETLDTFAGEAQLRDNIVQYIGGELTSSDTVGGELGFRDDVIYNQVLEAVMTVEGVHDVTSLTLGTSDNPSGTSNVSIGNTELATTTADDTFLTVSTTSV